MTGMSAPPHSALPPRTLGHVRTAPLHTASADTNAHTPATPRSRWRKIRLVTTILRCLRDRAPPQHGNGSDTKHNSTSVANANSVRDLGRAHYAHHSVRDRVLLSGDASTRQAGATAARHLDARSIAMQIELWLAKKRELLQRVIHKPIQNRSDLDIKLLADYISQSRSLSDLSSASVDELARATHFQMFHDGEVLFYQGDAILDTSGRFFVVQGSLWVYRNRAYAQHARAGDSYVQWFLAANPETPSDAVRFGECVDTCTVGDTCGDDALTGLLFRDTTVIAQTPTIVAYIMQASYKRVCRYNVPCDAALLSTVSSAFHPTKPTRVGMRSTFVTATKLSDSVLTDRERLRLLQRFFAQLSCFRLLPASYRTELMRKVEARVYRNDEVLCHASDANPKLFMVLSGRVCVHACESLEAAQLRGYDDTNYSINPPIMRWRAHPAHLDACRECEAPTEVAARGATTHICTLTAGDVFGEIGIRERSLLQGATLFNSVKSGAPCSVLTLSFDDYSATLNRYLEATEFTAETAYTILSETLPQDRSCEQVGYVWAYLTRTSHARVFFKQLPLFMLTKICLHAGVERHAVEDDIVDFVQREGEDVSYMRVVLNGYVCVFKNSSRRSAEQLENGSDVAVARPAASKPAVLTQFQSRLIRGNTKILDDLHATVAMQPMTTTTASATPSSIKLLQATSDVFTMESVSILPYGAAFGHHQIFSNSKSPYSYAAYSTGSLDAAATITAMARVDTADRASSASDAVHVLTIPARFVKIVFATVDEYIVYNPVRVYNRIAKEAAAGKSREHITRALHGLNLDRLLRLSPCFSGIPFTRLDAAVASLDVVRVPARRIIYDAGESTHGANFLVLSGHVRIFTIAAARHRSQQQQQQKAAGSDDKRLPKLLCNVSQSLQATHPVLEKQMSARQQSPFDRYAGDHIFLRDYDRTAELTGGDCFGRQVGGADDAHDQVGKRLRTTLVKRVSSLQQQQQQQQSLAAGGESAITMSECLIGTLSLHKPASMWTLDAKTKRKLVALIQLREELENSGAKALPHDERSFSSLATSFQILERMRLSGRLTTAQRVRVANSLRYCRVHPGDVVYEQGDESCAMYFILTGRVRLFTRPKTQFASLQRTAPAGLASEDWLVDLFESDVFGEEAMFDGCVGSARLTTAVAAATSSGTEDTELLYLTRQQYDAISAPHMQFGDHERYHGSGRDDMNVYARQLLGVGTQGISSRERWKLAITRVIQSRAKRSLWHSVLLDARRHRIELMFDLLGGLAVFRDTPRAQVLMLCASATLLTVAPDAVVFAKGDSVADRCFLVLTGTVMLQQFYSAHISASLGVGAFTLASSTLESSVQRVLVQTMRAGDVFGDFELLAGSDKRLIHATTCSATTKVIILPREDFRQCWPRHARLATKLTTIANALQGVLSLDADHLCSLYYAMQEQAFKRNEVLSGSPTQSGFLRIVESGFAIVHDRVTLQKRAEQHRVGPSEPPRLLVDTRAASLGPGSILFTPSAPTAASNSSGRRAAPKPDASAPAASGECEREFVTADSPIVHTFSLQLFPRSSSSGAAALQSSSRSPELFVMVVLGKLGLPTIERHISKHRSWRTNNTVYTSRVLESSLPKDTPVSPNTNSVKLKLHAASNTMASSSHPLGLTQFLRDRQLAGIEAASLTSPRAGPTLVSNQRGPRLLTFLVSGPQLSPCKAHQAPLGSFSPTASTINKPLAPPPALGVLVNTSESPLSHLSQLVGSPPSKPLPATPASPNRSEQLREEELVLLALASASSKSPINTRKALESEKQQRRRHGRPPPKSIENRGVFADEHAFTAVGTLKQEHERKKSGLCRRLLHLK